MPSRRINVIASSVLFVLDLVAENWKRKSNRNKANDKECTKEQDRSRYLLKITPYFLYISIYFLWRIKIVLRLIRKWLVEISLISRDFL